MIEQKAQLRYLRMAPRKVRLIGSLLQGMSVNEAEAQLLLMPKRAAGPLLKLLRSAVANAKNNLKLSPEKLMVSSVRVDGGPMLKRFLPRARGSASPIQKKMSHVLMVLREGAAVKPARFTIVPPAKRMKQTPKGPVRRDKDGAPETQEMARPKAGKGVFRRMFNRKSV